MTATPYRWKPGLPKDKHRRRLNAKAAAGMVASLMTGTPTMQQLVESSGLCLHTVRAYVKALHLAGAVRIAGWAKDKRGAYMTPLWTAGQGADAPKPPPLTSTQRMKAARKVTKLRAMGFRPPSVVELARAAA